MKPQVLVFDSDADRYVAELAQAQLGYDFIPARTLEQAFELCAGAEILLTLAPFVPRPLIANMPRLRWIQALTTGTDNLLYDMPELDPGVMITSMRGIHGPQMAELAFSLMLALTRDLRGLFARQAHAVWRRSPQRLLYRRHAVLVGTGSIAEALAVRCQAFGMEVTGVSKNPRPVPNFDRVVSRADLIATAAAADFLIVLVPYDDSTHCLIGADVIGAMKQDAMLISLSRGKIVDEDALLAALEAGRLGGAGLDVFNIEPLPREHPLWRSPKVIVTPHIGGNSDIYVEQAMPILLQNFAAHAAGRPDLMRNMVRLGTL